MLTENYVEKENMKYVSQVNQVDNRLIQHTTRHQDTICKCSNQDLNPSSTASYSIMVHLITALMISFLTTLLSHISVAHPLLQPYWTTSSAVTMRWSLWLLCLWVRTLCLSSPFVWPSVIFLFGYQLSYHWLQNDFLIV